MKSIQKRVTGCRKCGQIGWKVERFQVAGKTGGILESFRLWMIMMVNPSSVILNVAKRSEKSLSTCLVKHHLVYMKGAIRGLSAACS